LPIAKNDSADICGIDWNRINSGVHLNAKKRRRVVPQFQRFISGPLRRRWAGTAVLVATVTLFAATAWAAEKSTSGQAENEPIQIVADELISYNQEKYAEFIGNVIVTQGEFRIASDKLRIYYRGELLESDKKGSEEDVIKKIIATGNVKITSEQYQANADKAEYDTSTMIVVLSGKNSKVISGKNSISGSVIRLNQKSGQVKVEGSPTKRIKAEFFTKGNTSDAFKIEKSEE
jgi:lipopolysaccharide export system protein LptA